jgi:hypothetical protein
MALTESEQQKIVDELYKFIGQYVVIFQHIENKISDMLRLAIGRDRHYIGQIITSQMSNRQTLDVIRSILNASPLAEADRKDWIARFNKLVERLIVEGEHRNRLVHSVYVLDFVQIGAPPLRSKLKSKKSGPKADAEYLDRKFQASRLAELSALALEVGFAHSQIIHWHDNFVPQQK